MILGKALQTFKSYLQAVMSVVFPFLEMDLEILSNSLLFMECRIEAADSLRWNHMRSFGTVCCFAARLSVSELREGERESASHFRTRKTISSHSISLLFPSFLFPSTSPSLLFFLLIDVTFSIQLGFNPNSLSRDVPIENWTETFRSAMRKIQSGSGDHFLLLNPIVGPEGITGIRNSKRFTSTIE